MNFCSESKLIFCKIKIKNQMQENFTSSNLNCDKPAALTDFNGVAYMGVWYEQQHVRGQFF